MMGVFGDEIRLDCGLVALPLFALGFRPKLRKYAFHGNQSIKK
jgi:hypothetical protein